MNAAHLTWVAILAAAGFIVSLTVSPFPSVDRPAAAPAVLLEAPQTTVEAPVAVTTTTEAPITPGDCQAFVALAARMGWPTEELPTLRRVMVAESGCDPQALGDVSRGGSYGLMQIHTPTWCKPSRYWPTGYLQAAGVVDADNCHALFDPALNLYAALIVWRAGGWQQWATWRP